MLKVSISLLLMMAFTMLTGCANFTKPGMNFSEVEKSISDNCTGYIGPKNSLYFQSTHKYLSDVKIFVLKYPNNYDRDCNSTYHFKDGILLSDDDIDKLLSNQRRLEALNQRLEQERNERIRQEENDRINAMLVLSNSYINKHNANIIYRDKTFVIAQKSDETLIYLKDGLVKNESDVIKEIELYKNYIANQKSLEVQMRGIKAKNLAYRWVVQAQAVCPRGYRCWINSIKQVGIDDYDGSVKFNISHERWKGTAGSSGSSSIICGFNHPNKKDSTAVYAVCQ